MLDELTNTGNLFQIVTIFSLCVFILSPVLAVITAVLLPKDILLRARKTERSVKSVCMLIFRNVIAVPLLLIGIVMLVTPGQGLLTVFMALLISDFPLKDTIQKQIISYPNVLKSLNRIRAKFGVSAIITRHSNCKLSN